MVSISSGAFVLIVIALVAAGICYTKIIKLLAKVFK